MTDRDKEIYRFIETFTVANGFSPSLSDIAKHFDFKSINSAKKHVDKLRAAGVLKSTVESGQGASRARTTTIPTAHSTTVTTAELARVVNMLQGKGYTLHLNTAMELLFGLNVPIYNDQGENIRTLM